MHRSAFVGTRFDLGHFQVARQFYLGRLVCKRNHVKRLPPGRNDLAFVPDRVRHNEIEQSAFFSSFAIDQGLTYDIAAFNLWFNRVVRWLRKNGKRVQVSKAWNQYWLPGAWEVRAASGK